MKVDNILEAIPELTEEEQCQVVGACANSKLIVVQWYHKEHIETLIDKKLTDEEFQWLRKKLYNCIFDEDNIEELICDIASEVELID
ncbi:MAG: hypothetical protein ACTSWQ_00890 [Candidatus Thorarchaeota archaeon]